MTTYIPVCLQDLDNLWNWFTIRSPIDQSIVDCYQQIDEQSIITWKWFVFVDYHRLERKCPSTKHLNHFRLVHPESDRSPARRVLLHVHVSTLFPVKNLSRLQIHSLHTQLKWGFHSISFLFSPADSWEFKHQSPNCQSTQYMYIFCAVLVNMIDHECNKDKYIS